MKEIGSLIQNQITGKSFSEYSFKKKSQVVTLRSVYSSIKIGEEKVIIDPLFLFVCLVVIVERKPEQEIEKYFEYELSPHPMSLFKHRYMRFVQKSKLKSFLIANSTTIDDEPQVTKIADAGALLWCCNWKRNGTFENIFEMYANFLRFLQINTVVFDGYLLSTKDDTHKKCSRKASATIEIKEMNLCVTDRSTFLSNYENKKAFVKCLAAKLRILGFQVFECPYDADTTIVKVALKYSKEQSVIVYADDTDILFLLLHHYHNTPDLKDSFS